MRGKEQQSPGSKRAIPPYRDFGFSTTVELATRSVPIATGGTSLAALIDDSVPIVGLDGSPQRAALGFATRVL